MDTANLRVFEEFIETIKCVTSSKEIQPSFLNNEQCFTKSQELGFYTVTFLILGLLKKVFKHYVEDLFFEA